MVSTTLIDTVRHYHVALQQTLDRLPLDTVARIADEILVTYDQGSDIFVFGNGGSAATASHMACDLSKNTATAGQPFLRIRSLTDNMALLSALANDIGYEVVFAQQLLQAPVRSDDLVIAISGSGNSPNVLAGVTAATAANARTIGITGCGGGRLKLLVDIALVIPSDCMEIVEDAHLIVNHAVTTAVRDALRGRAAVAA